MNYKGPPRVQGLGVEQEYVAVHYAPVVRLRFGASVAEQVLHRLLEK